MLPMNAANHQESCRWLWQVISSGRFRLQVNKVGTHGTCGRFVSKTHAPIERDFNVRPHQFHLLDRYTAAQVQTSPVIGLIDGARALSLMCRSLIPSCEKGHPNQL